MGDFNCPLNHSLDTQNYLTIPNVRSRAAMINIIAENDLVDIFRHLNGEKPFFTWQKPNSTKRARLDYFLVSDNLKTTVKKHSQRNFIDSDHRPIEITLRFDEFREGKGLWRHKDKLLHDNDYHIYIKGVICNTQFL